MTKAPAACMTRQSECRRTTRGRAAALAADVTGVAALEYALMGALVAAVFAAAVTGYGRAVSSLFSLAAGTL